MIFDYDRPAGNQVEIIVRKRAVVVEYRKVHTSGKFIRVQSYAKAAARRRHFEPDVRFWHPQFFERREEVIVSGSDLRANQQLAIQNRVFRICSLQKFADTEVAEVALVLG